MQRSRVRAIAEGTIVPSAEPPRGEGRARRGVNVELVLSPAEAAQGGEVHLAVPVFRSCRWCAGAGADWFHVCPACDGRGAVAVDQPVGVSIPPMVRDRTVLEVPLDGVGIANFHLQLHVRIDPLAVAVVRLSGA